MTYNQAIKKLNYSGRKTTRTVLDYLSHEWSYTLISDKENILKDLLSGNKNLRNFLDEYILFYTKELYNKEYVVQAIPKSLEIIYKNSKNEDFKALLVKQYKDFIENSSLNKNYELEIPYFIKIA